MLITGESAYTNSDTLEIFNNSETVRPCRIDDNVIYDPGINESKVFLPNLR